MFVSHLPKVNETARGKHVMENWTGEGLAVETVDVSQWPQRGLQTWTLKVTLTDALERKWPGQWPLGAHFEGQPQRKTLRRETTLLEIRRNHQFLTKFGRRKAEVGKRWCAAPRGTQRGGSQ